MAAGARLPDDTPSPALRRATVQDAERLGRAVVDGVRGYEAFAPPGWTPPALAGEVEHLRTRLADPRVWCLVAEHGGEVVGQVTVLPAAIAVHPVADPGLAHLANLIVREDLRGTGLARVLHDAAIDAARARGHVELRLFTPAAHGRARRFYEREGWGVRGAPSFEEGPRLEMVEYRRTVAPPRR